MTGDKAWMQFYKYFHTCNLNYDHVKKIILVGLYMCWALHPKLCTGLDTGHLRRYRYSETLNLYGVDPDCEHQNSSNINVD